MTKKTNQYKTGILSVPKTSAQINHLCGSASRDLAGSIPATYNGNPEVKNYNYIDVIINLQEDYGLRISEVLAIKGEHITASGHIHIHGLKGSNNRIIIPTKYKQFWEFSKLRKGLIFDYTSRYVVYREYKKRGIGISIKGNHKLAVTHSFRHKLINNLRKNNINEKDISQYSGHKAEKNTAIYGKITD